MPSFCRSFSSSRVHLTIVSFMVVAAKVQEPMEDQLCDLVVQRESILLCLHFGTLQRNRYVSEIYACLVFGRERKHIGWFIKVSVTLVEVSDLPV